jgi:hypothetical protein
MVSYPWLPALVMLEKYGGDWQKYLDALYAYFKADFIDSRPTYDGKRMGLKRYPLSQGKEATFWHLISEGESEVDRVPDMRRCERIRWPRPVIEHSGEKAVKVWKNVRNGETRICLWLESEEYLVVLAERKEHVLPWTAYMVARDHQKQKLQREFEEYWKKKRP